MAYPNPQRIRVRCAEKNLPATDEIAAAVKAHDFGDGTQLWVVQFHWPTNTQRQAAIAEALKKLDTKTAWADRKTIPATPVSVPVAVKVAGAVSLTTQQKPLSAVAEGCRFVGEA